MSGNANVNLKTRDYPQSSDRYNQDYTITSTSERVATEINGRYWKIEISGSDLNQQFEGAQWFVELKESSRK